jgi:hypothetical protein
MRDNKDAKELSISAVETVSTAFMGMTVGCAKCHDHMFDPIRQKDFYAMKALFDPLVIKKQTMATPAELVVYGKQLGDYEKLRVAAEAPVNAFVEPYRAKLYADRVAMLPPDVQAIINKKEKVRTAAEQKIADDYFPVLRIDSDKIEDMISDKPKKARANTNTNSNAKKTADTTRDTITNTSTSNSNDSAKDAAPDKKDPAADKIDDKSEKDKKPEGPKPQNTPIQGKPSSQRPPANRP